MICDILFITLIIFGMILQILIKVIIQAIIPNSNFVFLASNIVIEVASMAVVNTFMSFIVNNFRQICGHPIKLLPAVSKAHVECLKGWQ